MRVLLGLAVMSVLGPVAASAQTPVATDPAGNATPVVQPAAAKVRAVPARTTRPAVAEAYRANKQVRAAQLAELSANAEDNTSVR